MRTPEEWASLQYNDPRLDAFAEEVEDKYNLPPGILVALKNAGERTNPGQVSPKGARGIMQFMPATMQLQDGKFEHNPDNPFESILAAGRYMQHTLKYQYQGDVARAVADYNGGPRQANALAEGGELAGETSSYLMRVRDYITGSYRERLAQRLAARQQGREQNAGQ
jgi:soluble lytic murein transglycosylase-like protein